jgi:L-iditol 2-dehydrogenase
MSGSLPVRQRSAFLLGPGRIEVRELPLTPPGRGELVVRVGAATTCGTDLKVFLRGGHPSMLQVPGPFGHELAGTVAARGAGVERFREGDRVVVVNSAPCGACDFCRAGRENLCRDLAYLNGAFAEYLTVPERFVATSSYPCPDRLPFELAALTEPLACVLHGIESCPVAEIDEIVLFGAGPIGLLFVAALAAAGRRVIAADLDEGRLATARAMGAAATVRVTDIDGTERVRRATAGGEGAALVIEATGNPRAWEAALVSVRTGGTAILFGGCPPGTTVPLDTARLHYSEITVKGVYHHRPCTARRALDILASGAIDARPLLSSETGLGGLEVGLRAMQRREVLKVVVRP